MDGFWSSLFSLSDRIRDSGLTSGWLAVVFILFALTFLLSLREVLQWFFGVYRLRQELGEIRETLERMRSESRGLKAIHELNFIERPEEVPLSHPEPRPQNFPLQR